MRKFLLLTALISLLCLSLSDPAGAPVLAQTLAPSGFIQRPRKGEALQGLEMVSGKLRGEGLRSARLEFAYSGVEDQTWFHLTEFSLPAGERSDFTFNFDWDTTRITDGNYDLRLTARFEDAEVVETVTELRVRNYSPVETVTPVPQDADPGEPTPGVSPSPTRQPTPTPLPDNPVTLDRSDIYQAFQDGLIVVGILSLLAAGYQLVKRARRGSR